MYQRLLELIKLIFGKSAINKTIGTRTNVIQLPNNKIKRYIKEDLNIEAASDAAAMNAKKEMEELIAEIPKMNDAERLIFEGNLRRLKNRLGIRSEKDPTADVYEFGTKLKATPKGIETLTEQAGQKSPPGTVMGNLESRLNRLKASGKDLGDIAKEEGGVKFSIPEEGIFNQELSADNLFDTIIKQQERFRKIQNSGLITSTAREILQRDIKAGKLKLPKEIEDRIMLVDGNPGTVNPVEVFRTNYGEDALEQLDSLIPELANAQSYSDLVKIVEKKYPMKPLAKPRKETMSLDEATKAEQENILKPTTKTVTKILDENSLLDLARKENIPMEDVEKFLLGEFTQLKRGQAKGLITRDKDGNIIIKDKISSKYGPLKKPEEPEEFATGGRVGFNEGSKLTDYLKTNISASTSSSSPEEGVKVKQEILDGIVSLNIPLNKKLKLLGDLKFGKNRAKVDLSELGKKYGIDLGEEVYKDKYFSPGLGAEYTTDEGTKFNLMVNPEDKGGSVSVSRSFATGGRVGFMDGGSKGLDYLMGIDRKNYQQGSAPVDELIINLLNSGSGDGTQSPSTTTSTPSTFQPTMMDMLSLAINPVMGIANIASRTKTGLSLAEQAMDAMGIGRGPGGRTEGYGVDSVNSQSVADQGVSVGDMGGEGGDSGSNASSSASDATSPGDTGGAGGADGAGGSDASSGADSAGDGGDGYATGGIVNRTGFKFGTKFGRFWKIARKVWDDINPTGDRKYDAQLVADELAEQIFKTSMDDLPQNVQIDLYALAYNNAPKVDALFTNPQTLAEAAKKGMAASKEMESLGLDVTKNSDFFKYQEMKLSGQLGPEHQVQAYKDKIRDEFYGVIDDTLMKQVEVDDNPQRLAEVYASIKEGLEMQRKGMTPEEIIRVMKQTPRTKNAIGGRVGFNEGTLDPAKEKQIKQMIKMGADVDTISAITGATPEQIQQVQQTPRIKNADGGLNYLMGY